MSLARANDAKAEDLIRTREALEETRAVRERWGVLRPPHLNPSKFVCVCVCARARVYELVHNCATRPCNVVILRYCM